MRIPKIILSLIIIILLPFSAYTQEAGDSIYVADMQNPYKFKATDVIAPAAMVGLGIMGLEVKGIKKVNQEVTDALWRPDRKQPFHFENITEYLPALANYGLNLCGVKGLHDYVDLTIIMGTAYLMMATIVYPSKDFISSRRPNGADFNSFPSGHSAWAFTGAEILRREFWHVSPWIGVTGYLVATATGFMRIYNGYHWLTDVLAGAGIGILCAEAAYWLYPTITKHLFPKRYNKNVFISPTATRNSFGVAASITF